MAKPRQRRRVTLRYPKDSLNPEDLLHFIEATVFTKRWEALGLDDDRDLTTLQLCIMSSPTGAPVIKGTGGLRKLRFSPPEANVGKSGGLRVCYVYFEEYGIVFLVYVYTKHEKDDLGAGERNAIREYIQRERLALSRRQTIS
ncbi:MAG: hypothetical protein ACYC35_10465 [Pirellulales bacterium]